MTTHNKSHTKEEAIQAWNSRWQERSATPPPRPEDTPVLDGFEAVIAGLEF